MFQDRARLNECDLDQSCADTEMNGVRSALRATQKLPSLVVEARISRIFDRVLDTGTIAALTDPSALPNTISDEQCEKRKKALAPYSGERLIGVLINLPGVVYTIEIDPSSMKVIHWECVGT